MRSTATTFSRLSTISGTQHTSRSRRAPTTQALARLPARTRVLVAIVIVVIVGALALGGYGLWYLFLQPPGPAAVSSTAPIPSHSAANLATTDGNWTVDTSVGSFSDFTDSWVGYRVQEQLASIGANTAVGRTPSVSGSLTLQGSTVQSAAISADLTSLRSDDSRRDGQLTRQGIETGTYPTATFTLTQPIDLGSVPADGQTVSVTATGDLTLHGVTRSVQIPLSVTRSGDIVGVTGSLEINFADYNVTPPSSFAVLSIADHGTMELQIYFRHA
jgi:polyisoprenoid-binding protein YceI